MFSVSTNCSDVSGQSQSLFESRLSLERYQRPTYVREGELVSHILQCKHAYRVIGCEAGPASVCMRL